MYSYIIILSSVYSMCLLAIDLHVCLWHVEEEKCLTSASSSFL